MCGCCSDWLWNVTCFSSLFFCLTSRYFHRNHHRLLVAQRACGMAQHCGLALPRLTLHTCKMLTHNGGRMKIGLAFWTHRGIANHSDFHYTLHCPSHLDHPSPIVLTRCSIDDITITGTLLGVQLGIDICTNTHQVITHMAPWLLENGMYLWSAFLVLQKTKQYS